MQRPRDGQPPQHARPQGQRVFRQGLLGGAREADAKDRPPETTLEGEVARVTYESEETGFRVVRVEVPGKLEPKVLVGVFPHVMPGSRVRATGRYEHDAAHGEQFRVETLLTVAPSTIDGLERYLASGSIPGIGAAFAKRIVATFGNDTLEVLDRAPERLNEVQGLGPRRAQAVIKAWEGHRAVSAIMIFLQTHGASPSLAVRIHKRFGAKAIEVVSRSPYRLALDVWGIGFTTADRIARSLGVGADAPERAQAGVLHTLHEVTSAGHVLAPRAELRERAGRMLERDPGSLDEAIDALLARGLVREETLESGEPVVYPKPLHDAEVSLARRLGELVRSTRGEQGSSAAENAAAAIAAFEANAGVTLAPAQRAAVEQAALHKVLVITGGPGVGKTTIVRAILAVHDRAGRSVRLAAPTGRAAKRMSEATGREAATLHRLLEFDPKTQGFMRRRGRPIDAKALIVDETSMLDIALADALLAATADDARLVLVGDVDQLPSVGPGAVLRDVIASGVVPTVRLTQIFRQAENSLIVQNAHRIHDGEPPESARGKAGEFYVFERANPEAAVETVRDLVTKRIPDGFGLDPVRDVQVLTPMRRGEAGSLSLNAVLQATLNPSGPSVRSGARVLRVHDKVMQLRNSYDKDVFNGDVGFVERVDEELRQLIVKFDEREVIYEEADLDELGLAYATSIHKSQGSEFPAVIVPILTQHYVMLARNLLYTAVTRAKRLCILVVSPGALSIALRDDRREQRRTHLAERLRREAEFPG